MLPSAAMKPQSFAYAAPESVDDVLELLGRHGADAAVLAGGQSLVPMMNLRLARPGVLVDINRVPGLGRLEVRDGQLCLGPTVRHRDLETGTGPGELGHLLARVAGHVGHLPIRVRGTVAGSLAHADPNAEWPVAVTALGAVLVLASRSGRRTVHAEDFFDLPFAPVRAADELLIEVRIPLPGAGWGGGFAEFAPTAGAFPTAVVCAGVAVRDGVVAGCRVAAAGLGGRPVRLPGVEAAAAGRPAETLATAARAAVDDVRASRPAAGSQHLAALVAALAGAALEQAAGRATSSASSAGGAGWT